MLAVPACQCAGRRLCDRSLLHTKIQTVKGLVAAVLSRRCIGRVLNVCVPLFFSRAVLPRLPLLLSSFSRFFFSFFFSLTFLFFFFIVFFSFFFLSSSSHFHFLSLFVCLGWFYHRTALIVGGGDGVGKLVDIAKKVREPTTAVV